MVSAKAMNSRKPARVPGRHWQVPPERAKPVLKSPAMRCPALFLMMGNSPCLVLTGAKGGAFPQRPPDAES